MSEAIDFRLTQHNLDMSSLRRVGSEVDRLYKNNLTESDFRDDQIHNKGVRPYPQKAKLKNLMYSVKDEANLMSYVSNRVQKAKNEVTTSIRDLKSLEKFKKSTFDVTGERNTDLKLGMRRRMQDVLNDLEIDALAFGVRNGLNKDNHDLLDLKYLNNDCKPKGKNRFLSFLADYTNKIDGLDTGKLNLKRKDHVERLRLEKREIFFTTNYTHRLADEIRLMKMENEHMFKGNKDKKWYRFENPLDEINSFKDRKISSIIKITRLAVVVFLREGGWINKKQFPYKNKRSEHIEEDWLKNYKKSKIFIPRVQKTAKKRFFTKEGGDILASNLMNTLNLRRITEANTPRELSIPGDLESQTDTELEIIDTINLTSKLREFTSNSKTEEKKEFADSQGNNYSSIDQLQADVNLDLEDLNSDSVGIGKTYQSQPNILKSDSQVGGDFRMDLTEPDSQTKNISGLPDMDYSNTIQDLTTSKLNNKFQSNEDL